MKKTILFLLLVALFIAVQAQEEKMESKNKPSQDIENLQLANQLAKYGYKTFSATALIEAAKIMSSVKTQDLKYESHKQGVATKDQAPKKAAEQYDLPGILAAARKFADGDAKLLSAITDLEKAAGDKRGRVGGPGDMYSTVGANSYELYQVNFVEGRLAEIAIKGDSDTDLDLYVFDSNENLVAKDINYSDTCYVSWVPLWTGRYIIKIVNRGPVYNRYHLVTN